MQHNPLIFRWFNLPHAVLNTLLWCGLLGALLGTSITASAQSTRELTHIKGDLYQFTQGQQSGIVFITDEGAVVGDPMDNQTAQWLRSELQRQFSTRVRYVFYSQSGGGRVEGGDVFLQDGASIVAHKNLLNHLPEDIGEAIPTVVFSTSTTLILGQRKVELVYPGPSASDDIIYAHFPDEQAVYTSDLVSVERLPQADLSTTDLGEWFTSIDRMNRLPFIYLLDGYGGAGIQNDAIQHSYYLRELHHRVKSGIASGASVDELSQQITLSSFEEWAGYDQLRLVNIKEVFTNLSR